MADYPEKTCELDRLIRHPKSIRAVLSGDKTEQRRNGVYAHPGEAFVLEDVRFTVTDIERQRLGDMTDDDAVAEGYESLEAYKDLILKMHRGMSWDEDSEVWVHKFARANEPA